MANTIKSHLRSVIDSLSVVSRNDSSLLSVGLTTVRYLSVYTYKSMCLGWWGGWVLEGGWRKWGGRSWWRCGVEAEGFSNIAVFLKFQFAYFDVRRRRSTLPLPFAPFSPLSNFRNFIECALGEFPRQMAPPSRQYFSSGRKRNQRKKFSANKRQMIINSGATTTTSCFTNAGSFTSSLC